MASNNGKSVQASPDHYFDYNVHASPPHHLNRNVQASPDHYLDHNVYDDPNQQPQDQQQIFREVNPAEDNCYEDHDAPNLCKYCGVRCDNPVLVYIIHSTACPYYAFGPQVSLYMGHNPRLRDQM